jgi:hairy-and-enhancer-of-split protein
MESVNMSFDDDEPQPMSRTHQYRKVMKPLLERKRRARINKCLDELKDLMVVALQHEGESITKLEKADVLELTVRHMQKLKAQNALGLTPQATFAGKFKAGYAHCAQEVTTFMTSHVASVDTSLSSRLLTHLSGCVHSLESLPSSACVSAAPSLLVAPTNPILAPLLTPPADSKEDQAPLDLSSKKPNSRCNDDEEEEDEESQFRKRQLSNDSDSGNSSMGAEQPEGKRRRRSSGDDDNSWRPW